MKKLFFLLVIVYGCGDEVPEGIIPKQKMTTVLRDLSILTHYRSYGHDMLQKNKNPALRDVLFDNYRIDSLQFAKSVEYYAKDPKEFSEMYMRVIEQLSQKKEELSKGSINVDKKSNQKP